MCDAVESSSFAEAARAPAMRPVLDLARCATRSSAHVLITGESGTGKRSLARWIHAAGVRRAGPLIDHAIALSDDGRGDPVSDPVSGPVIDVAQLAGAVPGPAPATSPDHRGRRSFPR